VTAPPLAIVVAASPEEAAAVVAAAESAGARTAVFVGDPSTPSGRSALDELITELA
jgi:hypothetical protein